MGMRCITCRVLLRAQGVRYFECPDGYGGLVRPDKVAVGDFPAIDEFADEDEI